MPSAPGCPAWIDRKVLSFDGVAIGGIQRRAREYFFNPTLFEDGGGFTVVCRYVAGGRRDVIALTASRDFRVPSQVAECVSHRLRRSNPHVRWYADPRWFPWDGRQFLSFNNGHSSRPNDIFVVEIDRAGVPVGGLFTAEKEDGRTPIEKNWGFFEHEAELFCVYSVQPLVILKCEVRETRLFCRMAYEHHWHSSPYERVFGVAHGGPAPIRIGDRFYYMIQGRKPGDSYREYFSGLLCFEARPPFRPLEFSSEPVLRLTPEEETLQPTRRLNPKVRTCLYPSGLVWEAPQGTVVLSYGINDFQSGVRRYDLDALRASLAPVKGIERLHVLADRSGVGPAVPQSAARRGVRTFYWRATRGSGHIGARLLAKARAAAGLPASWQGFRHGNVGDQVQELLVSRLFSAAPLYDAEHGPRLLGIGSIAHRAMAGDVIWGSGSKDRPVRLSRAQLETVDVRAVRGPVTLRYLKRCGFNVERVSLFFDPGALIAEVFGPELELLRKSVVSRGDIAFIPHYRDRDAFVRRYGAGGGRIVDVDATILNFCAEILSSLLVVSSSLHGIIFAEALGVPALMHRPLASEESAKYEDYYFGTGRFAYPIVETLADIKRVEPPPLPTVNALACLATLPSEADLSDRGILVATPEGQPSQ